MNSIKCMLCRFSLILIRWIQDVITKLMITGWVGDFSTMQVFHWCSYIYFTSISLFTFLFSLCSPHCFLIFYNHIMCFSLYDLPRSPYWSSNSIKRSRTEWNESLLEWFMVWWMKTRFLEPAGLGRRLSSSVPQWY